jgi:hypothetical protein
MLSGIVSMSLDIVSMLPYISLSLQIINMLPDNVGPLSDVSISLVIRILPDISMTHGIVSMLPHIDVVTSVNHAPEGFLIS